MVRRQELTFIDDSTLLILSSIGLLCVGVAVLWVIRQSPDWAVKEDEQGPPAPWWQQLLVWGMRGGPHGPQQEDGEEDEALGGRTRIVRGGREAMKAARKEAKKRAKDDFRHSQEAAAAQERRQRLKNERQKAQDEDDAKESATRSILESATRKAGERSAEIAHRMESYILDHKVSSLATLERDLGISLTEVRTHLKELETRGRFMGVIVDSSSNGADEASTTSYVRVNLDEMRTLAAFVNERGRLGVAEFTDEANKVLQLSTTCADEKSKVGMLEEDESAVKLRGD